MPTRQLGSTFFVVLGDKNHCCAKLFAVFLKRGKSIRVLTAVLLIVALAPGATILCLSSSGHVALESQLATCCPMFPMPSQGEERAVSGETSDCCAGCSDTFVLAVGESRFQNPSAGNDQAVFIPIAVVTVGNSLGTFQRDLSSDTFPSSRNQFSLNPLRC